MESCPFCGRADEQPDQRNRKHVRLAHGMRHPVASGSCPGPRKAFAAAPIRETRPPPRLQTGRAPGPFPQHRTRARLRRSFGFRRARGRPGTTAQTPHPYPPLRARARAAHCVCLRTPRKRPQVGGRFQRLVPSNVDPFPSPGWTVHLVTFPQKAAAFLAASSHADGQNRLVCISCVGVCVFFWLPSRSFGSCTWT